MKSSVAKRSIVIAGHKTSVSLEDAFWSGVREIAKERKESVSDLIASVDTDRLQSNLSSAVRLFVLNFYLNQSIRRTERERGSLREVERGSVIARA